MGSELGTKLNENLNFWILLTTIASCAGVTLQEVPNAKTGQKKALSDVVPVGDLR